MLFSVLVTILLTLCGLCGTVSGAIFTLEVEKFAKAAMKMDRSGAGGNSTVLISDGQRIELEFCLKVASYVSIKNGVYSNDGDSDTIKATLDNLHVGSFQTSALRENGEGWNRFKSTGPLAGKARLDIGRHTVTLLVTNSDQWGVELDNVVLMIDDENLKYSDLMCNLYCFDVKYDEVPRMDSIPSGKFVQKSRHTKCSEQDNIKIEVYHETAQDFDISATLPKYLTFANHREPDYRNCVLDSPFWEFTDNIISPSTPQTSFNNASLRFSGSHNGVILDVSFSLREVTPTREIDERYMGTKLIVRLRNMPRDNVRITVEYMTEGRWSELQEQEFTPFTAEHNWTIASHTWDIAAINKMRLVIKPGQQQVILESLRLVSLRPPDATVSLFNDADIVVQGVRLGFWHHRATHPESMTVYVHDGGAPAEYYRIDSVRIYSKVPWTGGYSQVLVLFQDGRTRIQTITPHGLDFIPFGASIFIGQPESTDTHRPYSPIKRLSIDPKARRLVLDYENGNKATFDLKLTFTETKLKVRNLVLNKPRASYPVMTFQSMWINDGLSDTDHVTLNGDISRHILADWTELYGISAVFFRKCISTHNTQGPDISIKFLSKADVLEETL